MDHSSTSQTYFSQWSIRSVCHDMKRFIFGIPWATKMRCQRSSCCHTSPRFPQLRGTAYGHISWWWSRLQRLAPHQPGRPTERSACSPSLHLTPEIDAQLRPSRATLIRQNIDTLMCGVGYWLMRLLFSFRGCGSLYWIILGGIGVASGWIWVVRGMVCVMEAIGRC